VIVFDMRAPGGEPEVAAAATPAHGTLLALARKIEILTGQSLDVAEGELASLTAPQQMALVAARLQSRGLIAADIDASSLGNLLAVYESNLRSIQAYRPPPAAVPILLIRGSSVFPDLVREHPDVYADPALGWRSLTHDQLIIREVPGNHMSMIRTPNASALAEVVDGCLSEIEAVR
jgi:thioesterase domain-containing protein